MALGVTYLYKWTVKNTGAFIAIVEVTGDAAYPNTGSTVGYPITPATFQLTAFAGTSDYTPFVTNNSIVPTIPYFNIGNVIASGAGGFTKIDGTTANLRFFGSTGTEITNGSTAAAISAVLMAFGV